LHLIFKRGTPVRSGRALRLTRKIPAGSKIVAAGHYDNSTKHKYNPAPEKEVFLKSSAGGW
jgi:hypothetical protein